MKATLPPVFPVGLTGRWSGLTFSPCPARLPTSPLLRGWSHDTFQQTSHLHTLRSLLSWEPTPGPPSRSLVSSVLHNYTTFRVALASHLGILSGASEFTLWGNLVGSGGCHWTASARRTASLTTSTGMNSASRPRLGTGMWLHIIFPSLFCPQRGASLSGIWERQ